MISSSRPRTSTLPRVVVVVDAAPERHALRRDAISRAAATHARARLLLRAAASSQFVLSSPPRPSPLLSSPGADGRWMNDG